MITAPDEKQNYKWAICEVKWFAVMQEDGGFERHDWEGVVLLQSNTEGKPGTFVQLENNASIDISYVTPVWKTETNDGWDGEEEEEETDLDESYFTDRAAAAASHAAHRRPPGSGNLPS